jgi:Gpi18-like mannosyltransferase
LLVAGANVLVGDPLISILLVSNLLVIAALYLLYCYTEALGTAPAGWVLALWVAWPTAFYLVAGYTESLWITCALGALLLARRGRWFGASFCAGLAALTRMPGVMLVLPLAYSFWEQNRGQHWRRWISGLWLGLIPLAYGAYALYVHDVIGGGWPWEVIRREWGFRAAWPWEGVIGNVQALFELVPHRYPFPFSLALDTLAFLLFCGLLVVATRRLPRADAIYGWALLILYAITVYDRPIPIMSSTSRYVLTLFPGFVALTMIVRRPWFRIVVIVVFGLVQLVALALFVQRIWVT